MPSGQLLDVGPGTSRPQPIITPDPDYPLSLRKRKIQGICVLGLTVDEHGAARNVHVMRSLDKRLDRNASDGVKRWRFKPAMRDGKPVVVVFLVRPARAVGHLILGPPGPRLFS
jgi:periplasmic protein TonB